MMATSSAFAVLVLASSSLPSSLFSGCVAFTPPSLSSSKLPLGRSTSSLPSPTRTIDITANNNNNPSSSLSRCFKNDPTCFLVTIHGSRSSSSLSSSSSRRRDATSSTALSMGIRSFIKRKILRKKDGGDEGGVEKEGDDATDDGDDEDNTDDDVTLHSILQSPGSAGLMESPLSSDVGNNVSSGDDDTDSQNDDDNNNSETSDKKSSKARKLEFLSGGRIDNNNDSNDGDGDNNAAEQAMYEETQDRIRRMKGGGMTEEEKAAFLNNALRGPVQRQKPRGPPIRQTIPGMTDEDSPGSGSKKKAEKESLWNSITSRKDGTKKDAKNATPTENISVASLMMDGKMKNEEAKRKYMESITNPDRFATFSTYQQPVSSEAEEDDDVEDEYEAVLDDDDDNDGAAPEMEGSAAAVATEEEPVETTESTTTPMDDETDFAQMKRQMAEDREFLNPNKDKQEKSAARDAVESILSMIGSNNDKKSSPSSSASAENATQTAAETTDLGARLERAAHVQERRDAEARLLAERKRETEKEAEKRRWAEAQERRAEELRRKEEERIERAREAAEAERRREEERVRAEREELEKRQAMQDDYWAKKLEKEKSKTLQSEPVEIRRKKEVLARDSRERLERDVAKDVAREQIRNEERAREDPHEGEILKEAAEAKLRDRERVRDIELQSAARISRTVPKPSDEDITASSFVREQRRKNEEIERLRKLDQMSLKSLNSPLPSPGRAPASIPPSPMAPVPRSSSMPDLSLASLTMAKKKSEGGPSTAPPTTPPSPPSPPQRLNLFEMTKLRQDSDSSSKAPSSTVSRTGGNKKKPAKRAVRQQLPLSTGSILGDEDDDDDDDDDMMRSGAPGLTVADALKQQRKDKGGSAPAGKEDTSADEKAKKWGIDMSKFK